MREGINNDQSGHANTRSGCEKRSNGIRTIALRGGNGQHQQKGAEHNQQQKPERNDLSRRKIYSVLIINSTTHNHRL